MSRRSLDRGYPEQRTSESLSPVHNSNYKDVKQDKDEYHCYTCSVKLSGSPPLGPTPTHFAIKTFASKYHRYIQGFRVPSCPEIIAWLGTTDLNFFERISSIIQTIFDIKMLLNNPLLHYLVNTCENTELYSQKWHVHGCYSFLVYSWHLQV